MKAKIISIVLVSLFTATIFAGSGIFQTDFKKASEQAKKENKFMLVDFSGSDWCGWCVKLDKEVFSKPAFEKYAKENLVCVLLDFPKKTKIEKSLLKQNRELANKYKIRGYPTVLIMNPDGEVVEKTGYRPGGAEKYVSFIKGVIEKNTKKEEKKEGKECSIKSEKKGGCGK